MATPRLTKNAKSHHIEWHKCPDPVCGFASANLRAIDDHVANTKHDMYSELAIRVPAYLLGV